MLIRTLRWLLSRPEPVLRALGGAPIERDGQTLDADAQLVVRATRLGPSVGLEGGVDARTARRQFARVPTSRGRADRVPTTDLTLALGGRTLTTRWYEPTKPTPDRGVLVWIHGGGWVLGTLDSYDTVCHQLARDSGCPVVSVDYRLAPEHPFPAAFDDVTESLEPLRTMAAARGWAARIALGGDSAGGNLTAAGAVYARDAGIELAGQLTVYPSVDFTTRRPSKSLFGDDFVLHASGMDWFADQYIGSGDRSDPRASPLLAPSLAELAPALVVIAGFDPLRDEGVAWADALEAAGVPVERHLYPGQYHGFFMAGDYLPTGRRAVARAADVLRTWLQETP